MFLIILRGLKKKLKKKGPTKNNETLPEKKKRAGKILSALEKEYPKAKCHLDFDGPFQLLIGCILSAQCTDKRVNEVTPGLFKKYPTPHEFARADQSEVEQEIHSCGFFRAKSKSILNCSKALVEEHDGEIPRMMDELTELAGVGRKTANVVLGNYFGIPGIIVDTHIKRLSTRLGLTTNSYSTKIEYDLNELIHH